MSRRFRLFGVAVSAVALASSLLVSALPASAGTSPQITVTPSTNLADGQTVTVTGSGWTPNEQVYLVECTRTTNGDDGCNIQDNVPIVVTSAGTFPSGISFKVFVGTAGKGSCGTSSTLDNCELSVGNIAQTESATENITFAGATTATAAPTTTTTVAAKGVTTTTAKMAMKSTITCVKGKSTKKVTGTNPKCPAGYKRK